MRTSWKVIFLLGCTIAAAGCSRDAPVPEPEVTTSAQAPNLDAPQLSNSDKTEISVPKEAEKPLNESDQESLDAWYLSRMKEAGIQADEKKLLDVRGDICDSLANKATVENLSRKLDDKKLSLSESQKGVVIASSMVSYCQDASLSVDKNNIPPSQQRSR